MNVTRLQAAPAPKVQRVVKEAEEKEAEFLALRLLNKRARVRLSPEALKLDSLPGRGVLFATGNAIGCFAAATCDAAGQNNVILSGLADLRAAFNSSGTDSTIPFNPRCTISLPAQPNHLCFASNDTRLLVGLTSGSIAIYDTSAATSGASSLQPLHVFSSPSNKPAREISANPGDIPDLVAVLYEAGGSPDSPIVELLDVQKLQVVGGWTSGSTFGTIPTAVCWSPRGKQVAIAMQSGDIATYSPSDTSKVKTMVPKPSSLEAQSIIHTAWLSNPDFHCIYAPPGPLTAESEQTHMIMSMEAKAATVAEVKLATPYLPFPGLRPPGSFTAVFRQWEPTKFMMFVGDSTSSDIGLVGCTETGGQESWVNYTLEETSTPTVPLDQDMNETVLLGLSLDLTSSETYTHSTPSGESSVLPPPPIMYAYASDGTVVGWNVLNTLGKPYPGMKASTTSTMSVQQSTSETMETVDMDDKPEPSAPAQSSTPAESATSPAAPAQPPAAFGQPAAPSGFGQSGFGQSGFGSSTPTASPFGAKPLVTGGFGAFAGPSKFGQTSAFGSSSLAPPPTSPAVASPMAVSNSNMSTSEDTMSTDTPTDTGFGGLSLGESNESAGTDKSKAANSMFGSFTSPPAPANNTSSAFGSTNALGGSVLKPATGFGAFGAQNSGSAFGGGAFSSTTASGTSSTPSSAFGSSGFAAAKPASPSSAFGSSGFGAKPAVPTSAFGQTAFGQSSFGQPSTPKPALSTSTGASSGGFAAFAQAGTSSFSLAGKPSTSDPKPDTPAQDKGTPGSDEKKAEDAAAPTISAFGGGSPAPPSTPPPKPTSAFGTSAFGSTSSPTPSGGAFSGLKASPLGFGKLDSGFGAFGAKPPSDSPFLNPPKAPATVSAFGTTPPALAAAAPAPSTPTPGSSKPVFGAPSAFGAAAAGATPASTPSSKPVFGAPSAFGAAAAGTAGTETKSPFGQPSTPPAKGAFAGLGSNSASAKGFSAFSSGFGSFAGEKKTSFGDLLRSETDGKPKEEATPKAKAPVSVFANLPPLPNDNKEEGASTSAQPQRTSVFGTALDKKPTSDAAEDKDNAVQEEEEEEEEDAERHEDEDDTGSFLSESFSDGETDEHSDGEEQPEDEDEDEPAKEMGGLALPGSSDAEVVLPPAIHLTESSPEEPVKKLSAEASDSTTPPGTPDKEPAGPAVASPVPVNAAAPSPFGLARPSTRPTRSSPLANAPIAAESDDDTTEKLLATKAAAPEESGSKGPSPAPKPTSSKSPSPEKAPEAEAPKLKTPPPMSLFGSAPPKPQPSPFKLAPAAPSPSVFAAPAPKQPTPSLFGFGTPATNSPSPKPSEAGSQAPAPKPTSVFSAPFSSQPSTPPAKPAEAAPAGGLFGQKPATPPGPGLFGPKPTPPAQPQATFPPGSLFAPKPASQPATPPPPQASSTPQPQAKPSPMFPPPPATTPRAVPPNAMPTRTLDPLAQVEEGMQKECLNLFIMMARELENLKQEALKCTQKQKDYYQAKNIRRSTADLGDPTKFGVGDLDDFRRLLGALEKDILDLKQLRAGYSKALRELETAMLKATMRKEEIVRFSKANTDAEFAKMLKSRTLGPEHLETQAQLRRGIRLLRDRIQKLEEHLQASKKRLSQLKMGKAGLRPPSLDTINRTYRNIDLAIAQQADDVARIASRLAKIDLKSSPTTRSATDFRSTPTKRSADVTPNVAATTAAALNAERAAQKLKRALLKTRKQPLLNKQAETAPAPPSGATSPRKDERTGETPAKEFTLGSLSWSAGLPSTPKFPHTPQGAQWSSPDSPGSPSPGHGSGSRREPKHAKAVPLKKSPGAAAAVTPPPGFSWGPLPGVTPMKTLSSDVRKKEETPPKPFSLSSSWVTDDFDAKK